MKLVLTLDGLQLDDFDFHVGDASDATVWWLTQAWEQGEEGYAAAGGHLRLEASALRRLPEDVRETLGVAMFDGQARVREVGVSGTAAYHWEIDWDGAPATVSGVWLQRASQTMLLGPEHAELASLAGRSSGSARDEVFRAVARLQGIADRSGIITLAGLLGSRRIHLADAIRISVEQDGPDGHLRPVAVLATRVGDGSQPLPIGERGQEILSQHLSLDGCVVPLGGGSSVVVPADVARAAMVTQLAAAADDDDRRRFLENPTAFLPTSNVFDEADYAERVIGAGFAPRTQTVPNSPTTRDWADDPGGVLIDTTLGDVWVPSTQLQSLHGALTAAVVEGRTEIIWEGKPIPAREAVVHAVAEAVRTAAPKAKPDLAAEQARPRILLIRENDVSLSYQRYRRAGRPGVIGGVPKLRQRLRAHQVEGVGTLQRLWTEGWSGALLCDDMGLGKTMQALAFAAWAREHMPDVDVPVLIVAPPSLLGPWLEEMTSKLEDGALPRVVWAPRDPPPQGLPRLILRLEDFLMGQTRSTAPVLEGVTVDVPRLRQAAPDVMLIGYDALRRYQFALGRLRFGCVILDEAQEAKDPNSLRSRALRAMNTEFSLVLTGTPIENAWRDLWTLCDIALPGMLGTLREFGQEYTSDSDVASTGGRLALQLAKVMVRRTRATALADLPPREILVVPREMAPDQALAYQAAWLRREAGGIAMLPLLGELSRISLHPRVAADLRDVDDAQRWVQGSARVSAAWEALGRFQKRGVAVLVFVRSLAMQTTLQRALQLTFGLADVPVLNGKATPTARMRMVESMRASTGFRVMLVSPEVGGAGWNFQFAHKVILLERPWNPAVEAQMIARVHRLGQEHPVEIVVPVATLTGRRTFDVVLDELLTEKMGLAEAVLSPTALDEGEVARRFERELG